MWRNSLTLIISVLLHALLIWVVVDVIHHRSIAQATHLAKAQQSATTELELQRNRFQTQAIVRIAEDDPLLTQLHTTHACASDVLIPVGTPAVKSNPNPDCPPQLDIIATPQPEPAPVVAPTPKVTTPKVAPVVNTQKKPEPKPAPKPKTKAKKKTKAKPQPKQKPQKKKASISQKTS